MSDLLFATGELVPCPLRGTFHLSPAAVLMGVKEQLECDTERAQGQAEVDVPTQAHGQQPQISSQMGHFRKPEQFSAADARSEPEVLTSCYLS